MKKLMLAMAVVVGAVSAQAATTYSYKANSKPSGVTSWENADMPYFHIYGLSAEQASAIVGKTLTSGVMTKAEGGNDMCNIVTDYIRNNYSVAKDGWADGYEFTYKKSGQDTGKPAVDGSGYVVASLEFPNVTSASNWQDLQYIVTFYDGDKLAEDKGSFRVLVLCDNNNTTYSGHTTSWKWGSFTVTTVPEPTSGLLMLLGVAGLALKRKRA